MKYGLVLEGGAMRGMFTAGVLDVFMENGIRFDGAVGVSAGVTFGVNIKSHQIGRTIRYNKRYCRDPRYSSVASLLLTGDLFNARFCYDAIPNRLDPFDVQAFRSDPMEFIAVATDIETGKPVYVPCESGTGEDMLWIRASASMPLVSRPVRIDGRLYLDGGITDSIPLKYMQERGYARSVAVLTQPEGYRKKPSHYSGAMRLMLRRYPNMAKAMDERWMNYNAQLEYAESQAKLGNILLIRPPKPLRVGRTEKDPEKLEAAYRIGRKTAEEKLEAVRAFLWNPEV